MVFVEYRSGIFFLLPLLVLKRKYFLSISLILPPEEKAFPSPVIINTETLLFLLMYSTGINYIINNTRPR